jgi:DNA-directed RNA polymerase beta subunit
LKTPGESIVKMFRKAFNKVFRQSVSSKIRQVVLENPNFTNISMDTILEGVNAEDIDKVLKRTINTGTEKIKLKQGATVDNSTQSSNLNKDNQLATTIEQRKIVPTSSDKKQGKTGTSESSIEIRYVHPTYNGYVCPVHSPDGQEVGLIKQLAITAIISDEDNSLELIKQILQYDFILPIENINISDMQTVSVSTVFVNGVLIGYSDKSVPKLRQALVEERRAGKIDKYVSIHADVPTGELNISCNGG